MPASQPSIPAPPAIVPVFGEAPACAPEDPDYALGCECADPALQIAWWSQDGRAAGAEGAS